LGGVEQYKNNIERLKEAHSSSTGKYDKELYSQKAIEGFFETDINREINAVKKKIKTHAPMPVIRQDTCVLRCLSTMNQNKKYQRIRKSALYNVRKMGM
jgi:hypothetical protein